MRVQWVGSRSVLDFLEAAPHTDRGIACITTFVTTPVPALREQILKLASTYDIYILASPIAVATQDRRNFFLDLESSRSGARLFNIVVLPQPLLHAKTVLLRSELEASLLVGSSNLTRGGLQVNEEVNLCVSGLPTEPIFAEHDAWFRSLWSRATPFHSYITQVPPVPDEQFLAAVGRYDASDLGDLATHPANEEFTPNPSADRTGSATGPRVDGSPSIASRPPLRDPRRDRFEDLYEYQHRALELAIAELRRGGSPCLGLPTGAGKTEVAIQIIRRYFLRPDFQVERRQKRLLVLTPKRELCAQFYQLLRDRVPSIEAHVVLYRDGRFVSDERPDPDRPFVLVATDQSTGRSNSPVLDRLGEAGLGANKFDAFILDEAHHAPSDMYHFTVEELRRKSKVCVGLTATPFRLDREPLGFDTYIIARLPRLIATGFLAQPNYVPVRTQARYRIGSRDLTVSRRDGSRDLSAMKLAAIGRDQQRTALIANEILAQKAQRGWSRTIVFCASMIEARNVAERLERRLRGQVACVVSDNDDDDLGRDEAVDAFRDGDLEVLVNCQMFIEGFDVPDADSIVIARPTMSLNYYKQMMGRGCRISAATGKTRFDLLDFVDDVDVDEVGAQLVHGNSPYGLFERGYRFLDDHGEDIEADPPVTFCDGSDDLIDPLDRPLAQVLASLDPRAHAHPASPFRRASRR